MLKKNMDCCVYATLKVHCLRMQIFPCRHSSSLNNRKLTIDSSIFSGAAADLASYFCLELAQFIMRTFSCEFCFYLVIDAS